MCMPQLQNWKIFREKTDRSERRNMMYILYIKTWKLNFCFILETFEN